MKDDPNDLEKNGHSYPGMDEQFLEEEEYQATEAADHEILMHRDSHFGGDFETMIDYYRKEGVGVHPDIDLERIVYLYQVEKELGQNLAPLLLTGPEAERVARAREAYKQIKEIYALKNEKNPIPRLLADLILSEEEEPEAEMEKIVAQGEKSVPYLIEILKSEEAHDPLSPGYGYAPFLAIQCLGKIRDERAIIPLFEALGKESLFDEETILEALRDIGEGAKKFLLKVLESRPLTEDNINAAFALSGFGDDPEIAQRSFEQLKDPKARQSYIFVSYLLSNCYELKETRYKKDFIAFSDDPQLDSAIRSEMKKIIQEWK